MKNIGKSLLFLLLLFIILQFMSYLTLDKESVRKIGMYNTSRHFITNERKNSIDVIILGDSLVYSSISPLEIWSKTGITSYNCSNSAQIIPDTYKCLEVALASQNPKLVFMEANVLFRDPRKRPFKKKAEVFLENILPIIKYHDNWKNLFTKEKKNFDDYKGFKVIKTKRAARRSNYMEKNPISAKIPRGNMDYFKKIIKLTKDNNIKLVLIGNPSQTSWNNKKHYKIEEVAKEFNLEFLNMNYNNPVEIDWKVDTRDKGSHVNYTGAKKVSKYLATYLKKTNMFEDRRNDKRYNDWVRAYEKYKNV